MPHVTLTHDDVVEDFATLCAGVTLGGASQVGEAAYLGMNAAVRERVRRRQPAQRSAWAPCCSTTSPTDETWVGVPAAARLGTPESRWGCDVRFRVPDH